MGLLDWIKSKCSKSTQSSNSHTSPSIPPAAVETAPPPADTSHRTILPNQVRIGSSPSNVPASLPRISAPIQGPKTSGSAPSIPFSLSQPPEEPAQTAPATSSPAVPDVPVTYYLSQFYPKIPTALLKPEPMDPERQITFSSLQLVAELHRGRAVVSLGDIYEKIPDIFKEHPGSESSTHIPLPLQQLVNQLGNFQRRNDQEAAETPSTIYETPFLRGAQADGSSEVEAPETPEGSAATPPAIPQSQPPAIPAASASPAESTPPPAQTAPPIPPHQTPAIPAIPPISLPKTPAAEQPSQSDSSSAAPKSIPFGGISSSTSDAADTTDTKPAAPRLSIPAPTQKTAPNPLPPVSPNRPIPTPSSLIPPAQTPSFGKLTTSSLPDIKGQRRPPATVRATVAGGKISIGGQKSTSAPISHAPTAKQSSDTTSIPVSLQSIVRLIPLDQQTTDPDEIDSNISISIPSDLLIPQLASGRIRIPASTFKSFLSPDLLPHVASVPDEEDIQLPLADVLGNIPPELLQIRADQSEELPDQVFQTPFSQHAEQDAQRFAQENEEASTTDSPAPEPEVSEPEEATASTEVTTPAPEPEPAPVATKLPSISLPSPLAPETTETPEPVAEETSSTPAPSPSIPFSSTVPDTPAEPPVTETPASLPTTSATQESPQIQTSEEAHATLQDLFMVEEELDARKIAKLTNKLPGVEGVIISSLDGLKLAGSLENNMNIDAICALIPSVFIHSKKFVQETNLGQLHGVTLQTDSGLLSFFQSDDITLTIFHSDKDLRPGVRDRLSIIANNLASIYGGSNNHR